MKNDVRFYNNFVRHIEKVDDMYFGGNSDFEMHINKEFGGVSSSFEELKRLASNIEQELSKGQDNFSQKADEFDKKIEENELYKYFDDKIYFQKDEFLKVFLGDKNIELTKKQNEKIDDFVEISKYSYLHENAYKLKEVTLEQEHILKIIDRESKIYELEEYDENFVSDKEILSENAELMPNEDYNNERDALYKEYGIYLDEKIVAQCEISQNEKIPNSRYVLNEYLNAFDKKHSQEIILSKDDIKKYQTENKINPKKLENVKIVMHKHFEPTIIIGKDVNPKDIENIYITNNTLESLSYMDLKKVDLTKNAFISINRVDKEYSLSLSEKVSNTVSSFLQGQKSEVKDDFGATIINDMIMNSFPNSKTKTISFNNEKFEKQLSNQKTFQSPVTSIANRKNDWSKELKDYKNNLSRNLNMAKTNQKILSMER